MNELPAILGLLVVMMIISFIFLPLLWAVVMTAVFATFYPLFILVKAGRAYKLNILMDVRNPSTKPFKRFAYFNKKDAIYKTYKTSYSWFEESARPYFDPATFAKPNKYIDGYLGISGKEDEDMFVPLGNTLMSGAMAQEFANKLSNAIGVVMQPYEDVKVKTKSTDKAGKEYIKEQNLYDYLKNTFTKEWVMSHFGIVEVKDANLILQHQKIQVADLHSRHSEFQARHESWFAKNSAMVLTAVMFVIVCIGAVILWNGASQNAAQGNAALDILKHTVGIMNKTSVPLPTNSPIVVH